MRLKVISSGYPGTTKVVNAGTGEELEWVREVTYHEVAGDLPRLTIVIIEPAVDIVMDDPIIKRSKFPLRRSRTSNANRPGTTKKITS